MLLVRINGKSRFELSYIFKEIIIKKGICRKYTLFPVQISFRQALSYSWSYTMVVRFTTSCAISAYHHLSCEFESPSWWVLFDTTLCDKVSQWLVAGRWFSSGTPVSSTNTTDYHNIAQILVKMALSTISLTQSHNVTNKQLNIVYICIILVNNLTCIFHT
jgi:hypothetical protein